MLEELFELKGSSNLEISKLPILGNLIELIFKIFLIVACYVLYFKYANILFDNVFNEFLRLNIGFQQQSNDFVYAFAIIPLFYELKGMLNLLRCLFIKVSVSEKCIVLKEGFFNRSIEKLYLKDIDNIELHTSFLGNIFGYSDLHLYSFGGLVYIRFLSNNSSNNSTLESLISKKVS